MLHRQPALRAPAVPGTSLSITFKGLGAYDYPSVFKWPSPQDGNISSTDEAPSDQRPQRASTATSPTSASGYNDYASHYRSPFSVLRSRQSRVNRCAAGMLGASFDTSTQYLPNRHAEASCGKPFCCCSALLYPSASAPASSAHREAAERVRDDFLWSLKLGGVEDLLKSTLGELLYSQLMRELGVTSAVAAVLACSNPVKMAQLISDAAQSGEGDGATAESVTSGADTVSGAYVARLLLSADEDNRIRWLQEESATMEPSDYYSRAPSLRALFVMWSVLQHLQRVRSASVLGGGGVGADGGGGGENSWGDAPRYERDGPRVRSPASARSPSSLVPSPRMAEVRHVLLRMEERCMEVRMSDLAALAAIGAGGKSSNAVPDDEFWDSLAKQLKPQEVAAALRTPSAAPSSDEAGSTTAATTAEALGLQHVLLLCLLLRYVLLVRAAVSQRDAAASSPLSPSALASRNKLLLPITAFEAASEVIQLRKALTETFPENGGAGVGDATEAGNMPAAGQLPSPAIRDAIIALSDVVLKHAYEMAEESHISSASPHLPELTTWLLREMVTSPVCEFHFKRLVDRSITEALVALEKSGLVNRSTINLKVVVWQLLPLLESCGSEDLYSSVLRDVLSALEEKARRDGYAFSAEDLQHLAELGTKLFSSGPSDSAAGGHGLFDETARGQMEELHVMDGSPWALCVSSYRSLKEMLQGIVRDQRRLKEQVQDQLRQLSNASSLTAVMTGTAGEAEAKRAGDTEGPAKAQGAQLVSSPESDAHNAASSSSTTPQASGETVQDGEKKIPGAKAAQEAPATPPRIPVPPMLRQRFLVLIEELVKAQVDESSTHSERPIVVSSELFAFVTQHVPVPNIQDEYRRKIFLLVNVAEDPETTRERHARREGERKDRLRAEEAAGSEHLSRLRRRGRSKSKGDVASPKAAAGTEAADSDAGAAKGREEMDMDPHGGANDIPAELRFLVSSLPLTLSPWASVMILREVLAESAGRNPRYTYVLNAAIDLQLPISTTRSRIATTLNMWRFLTTQSHKLSLKESLVMKQRCAWNLPLSYILSSYWSLLTWLTLASIVTLNVVGIDWESQIVANSLFRMFAPWEEICATLADEEGTEEAWTTQAAADLAADYFEQAEIADRRREQHRRSSTNIFLSSASYLILGYDDQRRPMTVIPIGSDGGESAEARVAEEYAAATAVLRELSLHVPFPFFVDIERALPIDLVEMRIAERIRRVSFNNTWFLPRMIIRTFPLGRQYTEHKLILHTCTQANLTRRRVTFLLYMHDGVAITPQFIQKLNESYLSKHANLVLVVHEASLLKGGTSPAALAKVSQSGAAQAAAGGADSLESIANAAAGMIESVLPEEATEAASAAVDGHVRVLPFCRQYYRGDGTVVSDAVRSKERSARGADATASATPLPRNTEENGGWWRRLFQRCVGGSDAAASTSPSATDVVAATSLPLFASAFSVQRASLHRSHQEQCEAEKEAAARQQREQLSGNTGTNRASVVGHWVHWWKHALSAAAGVPERMMRASSDSGEAEEEEATASKACKSAVSAEHAEKRGAADTTATPAPPPERQSSSDFPSGFQDDAMEDRASKDVVSVSFTAMRRLMAEVSAPVQIPRRKHTSSGGSGAVGGSASAVADLEASGSDAAASVRKDQEALSQATSSSSDGPLTRLWASFHGNGAAGPHPLEERGEAPTPAPATHPPSAPQATLRQPYTFTYSNNNTAATGEASAASPGSASSPPPTSHDATSPAPISPLASSLSVSSLSAANLAHHNGFKWESEWQQTDELLAQLRRTTRPST